MKKYVPCTKMELQELVDNLDVNLGDIDVSNITDMSDLFYRSKRNNFDGIETWDVSNVKNMFFMFCDTSFNGNISNWDVSNVENMCFMFRNSKFNGDVSKWDVSNVEDMSSMFCNTPFDGDISKWDVSNVKYMSFMFSKSKFNGNISNWDVSNVKYMSYMFSKSKFNGDISKWDISNVIYMIRMFSNSNFNQDISNWKLNNDCGVDNMFYNSAYEYNIPSKIGNSKCLQKCCNEVHGMESKLGKYLVETNVNELSIINYSDDEILVDINVIFTLYREHVNDRDELNEIINEHGEVYGKNDIRNGKKIETLGTFTIKDEFVGRNLDELEEELMESFDNDYGAFLEHISEDFIEINNNVFPECVRFPYITINTGMKFNDEVNSDVDRSM